MVGDKSAHTLKEYGVEASFIGHGGDTDASAKVFAKEVGDEKVLFPQSNQSLKSFEKYLTTEQVKPIVVYNTIELDVVIDKTYSIIVFTSPSNVRGYFRNNSFVPATVVALGRKTANELKNFNVENVLMPKDFGNSSLFELLN